MQRFIASSIIAMGLSSSAAYAQHVHGGDIELEIEDNAIVTHGARVFEGELSTVTASTSSPGFDSEDGTFAPNTPVTLTLLSGLDAWDSATSTFVSPGSLGSVAEGLQIYNGNVSVLPDAINTAGGGNTLTVNTNGAGSWHEHFTFSLEAPGSATPDIGVYRIELGLSTTQSGVDDSLPFWIVLNYGDSEFNHEAAVDATIAAVPEPATAGLLALGGLMALRRRRASV
ncbi:MAG TPA: PEP-CTERM sorting domain-containing protein [Tepidisphaeraceae bacterium]|jgi:hypothetical protein|nr:PEP-CTERM sorting domain-containing protein [Tepidisphaeraceae bacterium]